MAESPETLPQPTTTLSLPTIPEKTPAEAVYLFDQEMARLGVPYHATFGGSKRWYAFQVVVAESAAKQVRRVIDGLCPPRVHVRPKRFRGWWTDIEPTRLSKAHHDHPWVFAAYRESASDRDDGTRYAAFLFRNRERTVFGVREWLGDGTLVTNDQLERMARRVVTDDGSRRELISEDPDLPDMWKRH
jgi:hypothetical protein